MSTICLSLFVSKEMADKEIRHVKHNSKHGNRTREVCARGSGQQWTVSTVLLGIQATESELAKEIPLTCLRVKRKGKWLCRYGIRSSAC